MEYANLTQKQALQLGSNEKRQFCKELIGNAAINAVNPKGYSHLRVAESDELINLYFSESSDQQPTQKQPSQPANGNNESSDQQAQELAKMLSKMLQKQETTVDAEQVKQIVRAELGNVKTIKADISDIETPETASTREDFEYMVADMLAGNNIWLGGPTGSGKTVLAQELAKACGCKDENIFLVSCEPFTFKGDFWGAYKSATEYVQGAFERAAKATKEGQQAAVILDEITKLDPEIAGTLNAPLSHNKERQQHFTSGKGKRFDITDVFIIATSNTWGKGFDAEYVGNNQQDLSLLNRFSSGKYFVDYDRQLEKQLVSDEVFMRLDSIRSKMLDHKIRHAVTLRDMINIDRAKAAGKPLEKSIESLTLDWSDDERAKVGV